MIASNLYSKLEKDFIFEGLNDEWANGMKTMESFLSENFKKRSMGLACDFTDEINKVYTAVFPTNNVMQKVLDDGLSNAMLFLHHPMIWDINKAPNIFQEIDIDLLKKFKERNISIYNLHVPLDNYGEYSTSVTLAKALDITPQEGFGEYFGSLAGVIGEMKNTTVLELKNKFQKIVGHDVTLYDYGDNIIENNLVAIVAGGGFRETIDEVIEKKIKVFITGISRKSERSKPYHEKAEKNKVSILGGTHYSTEKFACIAMVNYFKKIGLESEFVEDIPMMEDI